MSDQGVFDQEAENRFLAHCKRVRYAKRSVIARAGEVVDQLMYIVRGQASVTLDNQDGKTIMVAYLGHGEFIGELALFRPNVTRSAWVHAHTECELAVISLASFHELALDNVDWLYAVGRQMAGRLVRTTRKTADFAFQDVVGRIGRSLIELQLQSRNQAGGNNANIRFTRQELAMMAGCSREVAGKALKVLEAKGLISVSGKSIQVSERLLAAHSS